MNKKTFFEYFFTALGTLITAIGIFYFLAPQNLAIGGVTGFSIVMTNYINLPISAITLLTNIVLLILGFIFIGREFGGKTIFSVIMLSVYLNTMENFFPVSEPLTNEIILNLTIGILLFAIGLAIVFNQNASTGGTDILAKILNKYFNLNFGTGLLVADAIIVFLAIMTFGLEHGLLGGLGWFLKGMAINYFIDGLNMKKEVVIISTKPETIKQLIFDKIKRGVTVYKAQGGYTNENKDIIVTALAKSEYFALKKELKEVDPKVFVLVRNVQDIFGMGFQEF